MSICNVGTDGVSCRDTVKTPDIGHFSLSPYFPEAIYVHNDCIYRWNSNNHSELLFSDWSTRFPVNSSTKTVSRNTFSLFCGLLELFPHQLATDSSTLYFFGVYAH